MKSINLRFELIIAIIIVLFFVLLQPKLSVVLFPQKREMILNTFIEDIKSQNKVNSRTFWKFREFYYPGYFKLEKTGFNKSQYLPITHKFNIRLENKVNPSVFLIYKSEKINSIEALVDKSKLNEVLVNLDNNNSQIILEDETNYVSISGTKIHVFFIKPMSEMILTNGYFDYKNPRDRALIDGKYWLSVSEIKTD